MGTSTREAALVAICACYLAVALGAYAITISPAAVFLALPQYTANRYLNDGIRLLNTGQYTQAKRVYKQALAQLWFCRDTAQLGLEKASVYGDPDDELRPDEIKQRIDHILVKQPDDPHAYLFLGDLYATHDDYTTAIEYYEKAIARDRTLAQGYFNLGVVYDKLGKIEQSLAMYECAVAHAAWDPRYLNNLAYAYFRHQDYGEALATYEKALKLDPQFLLTYFELANSFRARGHPEQALRYLEKGAALFDNLKLTKLEKNQTRWYFRLGADKLYLDTLPQKQCYAYRSLAATLDQLRSTAEAKRYREKPCASDGVDERNIQKWVEAESRHIGSAR